MLIGNGAAGKTIGGTATGAGNVIVGNADGIDLENAGTTGNLVQGNYIGTNAAGATGVGNGRRADGTTASDRGFPARSA